MKFEKKILVPPQQKKVVTLPTQKIFFLESPETVHKTTWFGEIRKKIFGTPYKKKLWPPHKKIFFRIPWNVHKTTWFGEIRKKIFGNPPTKKVVTPHKKIFFLESHETCIKPLGLAKFEKKIFWYPQQNKC